MFFPSRFFHFIVYVFIFALLNLHDCNSWKLKQTRIIPSKNEQRHSYASLAARCIAAAALVVPMNAFAVDSESLQQQLKSYQKVQVTQQRNRLQSQQAADISLSESYTPGSQVAKGIVVIPELETSFDLTQYPLGIEEASSLDSAFNNEQAALIITAVGREGQPVAARKYKLKDLRFPIFVQLTADENLMFPFTTGAWLSSAYSKGGISMTAVLDEDGRLQTSEASNRFGFAISDVNPRTGKRITANININFKSDGAAYSNEDAEFLARIDKELDRMGFTEVPQ